MHKRHGRIAVLVLTALALAIAASATAGSPNRPPSRLELTHGIASGDVTASSAVVWGRASAEARMQVFYDTDAELSDPTLGGSARALRATDYTAKVVLDELESDTRYWYRVEFRTRGAGGRLIVSDDAVGTFKTPPRSSVSRPLSFTVGGDLAGQQYCRNAETDGYAIFNAMEALQPDYFIANGDMIYADGDCPEDGPGSWVNIPGTFPSIASPTVDWTDRAEVREVYLDHWRYNREDGFLRSFLASTPMYSQWDDHEVINDFGSLWTYQNPSNQDRAGFPNLVAAGRDAFFNWSPISRNARERNRIYRSFSWGRDADLFILDARSYRSRNNLPDTAENNKTLLGRTQLEWVKRGLRSSRATWKVVSNDVPISITTGSVASGRDGYANGTDPTGFERELLDLLRDLDRANIKNLVFVTTDVHFAYSIRYDLDADGDGDRLVFHEFVTGPMNAIRLPPPPLDPTASPTSLYSEGNLFNFGYVQIGRQADGAVHLIADVRGVDGQPRAGSRVDLTPQP